MKKLLMFLQNGWNVQFFTRGIRIGTEKKFVNQKRCSIRCTAAKGKKKLSTPWISANTNREGMKFALENIDALMHPKNVKLPKVATKVQKKKSKSKK